MKRQKQKLRVGILGCGAIGSGIAKSMFSDLKNFCELTGVYDIDENKAETLEQNLPTSKLIKNSIQELLNDCDLMVEAVNAADTPEVIKQALEAQKDVLAMSTGKLLNADDLFALASEKQATLILPSGAIAGIDAIKAASLVSISTITLTTRKPITGFKNTPYLEENGIDLSRIETETTIFEGGVNEAVKHFPKNINVAATLALASQAKDKLTIRITTSPEFKRNSHEVVLTGDFGKITTRTDNEISPDNPKTSYLAILSAIQSLKSYCNAIKVGI